MRSYRGASWVLIQRATSWYVSLVCPQHGVSLACRYLGAGFGEQIEDFIVYIYTYLAQLEQPKANSDDTDC